MTEIGADDMSLNPSTRPGDLVCLEERCPHFGQPVTGRFCNGCGQPTEAITGAPAVPQPILTTDAISGAPAELSSRFVARLIDAAVVLAPVCLLGLLLSATDDTASSPYTGDNPVLNIVIAAWYAFALLYEFVMLAAGDGQTIGKRVMKIRVVKLDGQPIGWGAAAGRVYIQSIASVCSCGLAGLLFALSPLFDSSPWNRGWPDRLASTVVVRSGN